MDIKGAFETALYSKGVPYTDVEYLLRFNYYLGNIEHPGCTSFILRVLYSRFHCTKSKTLTVFDKSNAVCIAFVVDKSVSPACALDIN